MLITKTIDIQMDETDSKKVIKIGKCLNEEERDKLVCFLLEFKDIFSWTYSDMLGIDSKIVTHNIVVKPNLKPMK